MKDSAVGAHEGGMKKLAALLTFASTLSAMTLATLLVGEGVASASSPAGVWADVEKITYEPNANDVSTATRAVIHGVFVKSSGGFPATYAEPVRGYFYYECPSAQLATCRMEWQNIAQGVGTDSCAGWGDAQGSAGTVIEWCAAKPAPQPYPIHMGVQLTPYAAGYCAKAKAFAAAPTCGGSTDAGPAADAGRPDTGTAVVDTGTTPVVEDTGAVAEDAVTPPSETGNAKPDDTLPEAQPIKSTTACSLVSGSRVSGSRISGSREASSRTVSFGLAALVAGTALARRRLRQRGADAHLGS